MLADGLLAAYLLALEHTGMEVMPEASFADPVELSFDVPPEEAINYFRDKRVVKRAEFDDLTGQARAGAFTVGGIYRKRTLEAFKKEIARALAEGTPEREVIKRFRDILSGAGHRELGAFPLETIFRTNMQTAYGTGRRRALERVAEDLPFWTYNAVLDDRTRPAHRALDGVTLPTDHPFWQEHFPPFGFNCRCAVTASVQPPKGYDASNPSGEAQLVYDKRGVPAKAEYGTSVIDLGVSKFPGIPPQGTLQDVIERGAKR